jgi:uncharacterized protein (TIGR03000 family)
VCLVLPGAGLAQTPPPEPQPAPAVVPPTGELPLIRRPDWEAALSGSACPAPAHGHHGNWVVGIDAGPGKAQWHSGWPYGPRIAPPWGYPGLWGGPFVGYPWGWPGYSGRAGQNWSNGLSLYGPPVPVYGPVPGIIGNRDLVHQWRDVPSLGIGYGWFGVYAASPRPRHLSVNVWPVIVESVPGAGCPNGAGAGCATPAPVAAAPVPPGGVLILSVKVPQPAAEVFVDGAKTVQTGTDRLFESPPLEAGKRYQYEVTARWIEGGKTRERKMAVVGTAGEVVRVDFTAQDVGAGK